MKIRRALLVLGVTAIVYLAGLIWIDARNQVFAQLPRLLPILPGLFALSLLSWLVRYLRWYWLLRRAGSRTRFAYGFLAYLSGFAFTATPGKVGELLRIRYLARERVPPWRVVSAFVFERALDLVVVLTLSALAISRMDVFIAALLFVLLFLLAILLLVFNPRWLAQMAAHLRACRFKRLSRLSLALRDGLRGCRTWATPVDVLLSLGLGMIAWSLTSLCFVFLLRALDVPIPLPSAMAIYPLAMLAGAASMLPGGIGSTEVAIVALLSLFNLAPATATLAAVGIRIATMWFAVFCGFFAVGLLERQSGTTAPV